MIRWTQAEVGSMDRQELFLHYVNRAEVPDYYTVIKEPMCWMAIDEKIERNEYRLVEDFKVCPTLNTVAYTSAISASY
jgi:NuA3 HAT complex component NTO1